MSHVAEITTPFPTLEEVAASLGISKKRQREIQKIVDSHAPKHMRVRPSSQKRNAAPSSSNRQKGPGAKAESRA